MKMNEDYLFELTTIFFIRKKVIIGVALLISLSAVFLAFFMTPKYAIVSNILVKGKQVEKNVNSLESGESKTFELSEEDLNSEIEILTSPDVIRKSINLLAAHHPLFGDISAHTQGGATGQNWPAPQAHPQKIIIEPKGGDAFSPMNLPERDMSRIVNSIKKNLTSEIVPHSNVIKVTLATNAPEQGRIILEKLLEQYMAYRSSIYNPKQAAPFFKDQADDYRKRIIHLGNQLDDLASDSGTADPLKEIESNLLIRQNLSGQLNLVKSQLIEKQEYVGNLSNAVNSDKIQFFAFVANLSIDRFSDKLQSLIVEKGDLLRKFHPESMKVLRVEEQIQETYNVLKSEVHTYLTEQENQEKILRNKVGFLESSLDHLNKRNIELHISSMAYNRLKKDLDLMQNSYSTLMTRWEETKIQMASDVNALSLVSISSQPHFSGIPVFPNKKTLIPAGVLAGIVTGLTLGYLLEYFDQRIKRPEDVRQFIGQPTIFSIPLQ